MLCDPSVDHRHDFFMLDEFAALDGSPPFFHKGEETRLLLRRVANRPCREPGSAPALGARHAVHQGKRFRIQTGGNYSAAHRKDVYLVYIRFKAALGPFP